MQVSRRGARRADLRWRRQRGATLVEMALILPLLVLILVSITEIGLYFRTYLAVTYASREGARIGAFVGNDEDADCQILAAIGRSLSSSELNRITEVEIFEVDQNGNPSGMANTATYTGGDPTSCNEPPDPGDSWSRVTAWPSTDRQVNVGSTPLDILGVRIRLDHDWVIGFPPFRGTVELDDATIIRLEPEAFE